MSCDGCKSLMTWIPIETKFLSISKECAYTRPGTKDIWNCPCKECLIKNMCKHACDDFNKVITDPNNSSKVLSSKLLFADNIKRISE